MRSRDLVVAPLAWTAASVEAWRALIRRCPDATAFQHPDWLVPWSQHLARGARPMLLGVHLEGALVGLAPLARAPTGEVVFAGGEVTDYRDLLALPELRRAVAAAVIDHLRARGERCELSGIEERSPLRTIARGEVRPQDVCPYLPIARGAERSADVVPAGFSKRLAQAARVARRAGAVETLWASPDDLEGRLETLFALHSSWWRARGQAGVLAHESVRAFWRAAAPPLLRCGWLWLVELRLDRAALASAVAFAGSGRVLHYLAGADPAAASLSPGRLAIAALLERAIAEGARELDFLRGVEPYKYDWGARNRSTYVLTV